MCKKLHLSEKFESEELTSRYGPIKKHRVGCENEQHRCVCGDIVRNSMLEALLTAGRRKKTDEK